MRRTAAAILAALMIFAIVPLVGMKSAKAATDYSNVRVLLSVGSGVKQMSVSVSGSYFVQENGKTFKNGTLTATISGNKVVLSHSTAGQLYSGTSVTVMREKIDPSYGSIRATVGSATRNYLGHFTFKYSASGLRVINTVPLAHYLYGVVRGEMNDAFPLEALKAQAVAAKCYVIANMTGGSDYDIGDTANDQVYKGYVASEKNIMAAVDATYNVGLYLGSSILSAYYAASNGGSTLLPSDVWSGTNRYIWDKAFSRVSDPYDLKNPLSMQETVYVPHDGDSSRYTTSTMSWFLRGYAQAILRQTGQIGPSDTVTYINEVTNLALMGSTSTTPNATMSLVVTVNDNSTLSASFSFDIKALRYNNVFTNSKSSSLRLITVTNNKNKGYYEVYQGRYGHGVGMSQRGAEQMANEGWKYEKILKFYYPGATIKNMGVSAPSDPVNTIGGDSGTIITPPIDTGTDNNTNNNNTNNNNNNPILSGTTGVIITTSASIRTRASAGVGTIVGRVNAGTVVQILGTEGSYYQVQYGQLKGYIVQTAIRLQEDQNQNSGNNNSGNNGTVLPPSSVIGYGQTTASVNFRQGPSTNHSIIRKLNKGEQFSILGKESGWYYVNLSGTLGYISGDYVKETSAPSTGNDQDTGTVGIGSGQTTAEVNFRQGPSTSTKSLKKLSKGTQVTLLSKYNSDWYHVDVSGTLGYVSSKYIKLTNSSSGTETPDSSGSSGSVGATMWTGIVINEWVWLRSSASATSDANKVMQLPVGTQLYVHSQTGNFYRVTASGTEGYAHKDYINITGEVKGNSGTSQGVTNATVNLRSGPSTSHSTLATLKKGSAITILGESGEWYQATYNNMTGYLVKRYVTTSAATGSSSSSSKTGKTTGSVRLRSAATTSSDSNIITTLAKGTTLTINSGPTNGWYNVTVNGQTGYVSATYVKLN
ncbi:SH3 domain-containing protein [Eubacteriales bacterium OttesenSCG-928-K08]|nr:SH3 domain-containing protein [Eubacteriales bacterium OttesenSCG-928-K08]